MARAVSTRLVAVVVIAMIIVVGLAVVDSGALNSASSRISSTSDSTSVATVNSTSSSSVTLSSSSGLNQTLETTNSTLGLKLLLSVNSTAIPSEDAINISTQVLNTRPTANNLTASDDWAIQDLSSGPCDLGSSTNKLFSPVGLGVFRGTYALNNISSAGRPLFVWAAVSCPADFIFIGNESYPLRSITSYSLLPKSDNGTYAGYYAVPGTPETLAEGIFSTRLVGGGAVYATNGTGFYNSLHSALPSNYTLVAGDVLVPRVLTQNSGKR